MLKRKLLILISLVLISSCISGQSNDYCLIDEPLYFSKEVVDAMNEHEKWAWISHNETIEEICK